MSSRSSTPEEDWMAESEDEIHGSGGEEDTQSESETESNETNEEDETVHLPPIVMDRVIERTLDTEDENGNTAPDVHFQVFSQVFHLHSDVLKQHSEFFRAFLESPEKTGLIDRSARFQYRWVSSVEEDGTWSMVWEDPNTEIVNRPPPFDVHNEIYAFKTLLDIFYDKRITLRSVNHLQLLAGMADYYDCLPIVGSAVAVALPRLSLWASDIEPHAEALLTVAYKLQNKVLWKECLIYLVGAWRAPLPSIQNQRIFAVLERLRRKLQHKVKRLHQRLLVITAFPPANEIDSVFDPWALSDYSRFLQKPIPKLCKKLLALYQHQIPAWEGQLPHLLAEMLENHLQLVKRERLETGVGECQDRFLFIEVTAEEAEPWSSLQARE